MSKPLTVICKLSIEPEALAVVDRIAQHSGKSRDDYLSDVIDTLAILRREPR